MVLSEVEIYNSLYAYNAKIKGRKKIKEEEIKELLDSPKYPLENQGALQPLTEAEDILRNSLVHVVMLHGFQGMNEDAQSQLFDAAKRKLTEYSIQFLYSKSRRSEGIETGFSSSLQHVLCLHGIQDPLTIKKYYDMTIKKPLSKLQEKMRMMVSVAAKPTTAKRKRSIMNESDKRAKQE